MKMMTVGKLKSLPSADSPGKTVAEILPAKRLSHSHAEHVESVRRGSGTAPVHVHDGALVDGHHRVAAHEDAKKWWVPVHETRSASNLNSQQFG